MHRVTFSDKLKQDGKLYLLAERANGILNSILGNSEFSAEVSADWDRSADEHGRPLVTIRLRDDLSETTGSFPPWHLQDDAIMRSGLRELWLDLLKVQSDVQHAKVEKLVAALDGD